MDAIVAGTLNSAKSCWVDDEVGSLQPGKAADVLVVDGDPSKDITHLWNVVDVYQGEQGSIAPTEYDQAHSDRILFCNVHV